MTREETVDDQAMQGDTSGRTSITTVIYFAGELT